MVEAVNSYQFTSPKAWFHVDMDGLDVIYQGFGKIFKEKKDDFYITAIENSLSFFKQQGIIATYFLIAKDLDDSQKIPHIKRIIDSGHNIACHGYYHKPLCKLSKNDKCLEIIESKKKIEETLGVKCLGFRAPRYSIDIDSFNILQQVDYKYDSSIYPNRRFRVKLAKKELPREPFILFPDSFFFEVPLPYTYPLLPPFHASYVFYLRSIYFKINLKIFRKYCNYLTFLFHLTDFATPQQMEQGLKLKIFTNSFFSKKSKFLFLERLINYIGRYYSFTTTEDYLTLICPGKEANG